MTKVRPATLDDAGPIGEVHVRAWQAAYRGIMSDEYLDGLRVEEREEMWRRGMSVPRQDIATFVVESDESDIVGFAESGRPAATTIRRWVSWWPST